MRRRLRNLAVPLLAGLLVLPACGRTDAGQQGQGSVAATADRLAQQTAAGDDCAAAETAAELRALVAQDEQLPESSRQEVGEFLDTLAGALVCEPEPEPEPEESTPTVEDKPDEPKKDNPGKGKGRGGDDDDDDDDEDDD